MRTGTVKEILLSLFLAWHSFVMIIGPAHPSYLRVRVEPLLKPYQRFLSQDNQWGFFAPAPAGHRALRYRIMDSAGRTRLFALSEALKRSDPSFHRYVQFYGVLHTMPSSYLESAARHLCRRHADMHPRYIQFVVLYESALPPEFYLEGKVPSGAEFYREERLRPIRCEERN